MADTIQGGVPHMICLPGLSARQIYERTFECSISSTVLGCDQKFTLILPVDYETGHDFPVVFVLHGLGRDHLTVVSDEALRSNFLSSGFIAIFPDGKQNWYIDSEVEAGSRYQSYLSELIVWVKTHLKVSPDPRQWSIFGWSMGAFGAANYVMRYPGVFQTLGTIIGLLDFPNSAYAAADNFAVSSKFPCDEQRWAQYQAVRHPESFRGLNLMQYVGKTAFDLKMNRTFHQALLNAGIRHEYIEVDGGHEWSVVAQGLPRLLVFVRDVLES